MILQTYWTFLLIFFTAFLIYCNITIPLVLKPQSFPTTRVSEKTVQKIVAYSLMKQIELEGEKYLCDEKLFANVTLGNINREINGIWKRVKNTELYVLSVTLDKRLEPYYYLRIIGVIKGSLNDTIYCQILTSDGHIQVIKSTVMPIWYKEWDLNDNNTYYNPTLISCRLPVIRNILPINVFSISTSPCEISNEFYEISKPVNIKPRNFTLCVKPLNFKRDVSIHLVQWIEICKILGADFFYLFVGNVTKNTRRILEWYKKEFPDMFHLEEFKPVHSKNTSTPKSLLQKTWQRRRYEIIAYNNCFYKNINSRYVIPIDIDELLVPKTVKSWHDLVQNLDNYSSLIVQNVYFFSKATNRFNSPFFLRENTRTAAVSKQGENGKSFISTKNTLTVFNHYSLHLLRPGVMKDYFLPFREVQLNHYKEFCNTVIFPECFKYLTSPRIVDNVMFKYRENFNERYRDVINKIKKYRIKL